MKVTPLESGAPVPNPRRLGPGRLVDVAAERVLVELLPVEPAFGSQEV